MHQSIDVDFVIQGTVHRRRSTKRWDRSASCATPIATSIPSTRSSWNSREDHSREDTEVQPRLVKRGTTGDLTIPNLDYSLETQNPLANVSDWFNYDDWRDALRAHTRWNLRDQANANIQALTAFCGDHGPLTVRGRVAPSQMLEIAAKADGIYTKLAVDGEIGVTFRPATPTVAAAP